MTEHAPPYDLFAPDREIAAEDNPVLDAITAASESLAGDEDEDPNDPEPAADDDRHGNWYERKQERKRERLQAAATRADAEATARFQRSRDAVAGIPFGQPILVGHHSEGRHRAALKRSDTNMRKAVEATDHANELRRKAEAIGTGGISSDDPDAVDKLRVKVEELEEERELMKAINVYYRQNGKSLAGIDGEPESNLCVRRGGDHTFPARLIERAKTNIRHAGVPFPSYSLTNLGARIRDAKARASRIESRVGAAHITWTVNGNRVEADPQVENRVLVSFPAKLPTADYKVVRGHGFVWSPSRSAFVRKYSSAAVYLAQRLAFLLPSPIGTVPNVYQVDAEALAAALTVTESEAAD